MLPVERINSTLKIYLIDLAMASYLTPLGNGEIELENEYGRILA